MRTICLVVPVVLWVVGVLMLCNVADTLLGVLFSLPFTLGPQAVSHLAIIRARSAKSRSVLLAALLAYFAWFTFIYIDAFYIHLDPQSAIALLFVGIYSLPILAIFWLVAYTIEWNFRSKQVLFERDDMG